MGDRPRSGLLQGYGTKRMENPRSRTWLWLSALVVVLDQATKALAELYLDPIRPLQLLPIFDLRLAYNRGAWVEIADLTVEAAYGTPVAELVADGTQEVPDTSTTPVYQGPVEVGRDGREYVVGP